MRVYRLAADFPLARRGFYLPAFQISRFAFCAFQCGASSFRLQFMHIKLFAVLLAMGLAGTCIVNAQSPSPAESPSPAKKHRVSKKAAATASPAEEAASPSSAESPSASPKPKRARKGRTAAAVSPTVTPSPSPAKKTLADFFKPKSSVGASPSAAGTATPAAGGGHGLVWVNTETHVYHKEGSHFYGTTQHGKYVSEADAIKEGDRPSKGQ
jgi:hypothetical protein